MSYNYEVSDEVLVKAQEQFNEIFRGNIKCQGKHTKKHFIILMI